MAAIPKLSIGLQRGVTERLAREANVEIEFWRRMGLQLTFTYNYVRARRDLISDKGWRESFSITQAFTFCQADKEGSTLHAPNKRTRQR